MVLSFADLFCGAGGLSYGFKSRKHKLLLAIDEDKYAIDTFKYNFKNLNSKIYHSKIQDYLKNNNLTGLKLDLVMGGPPCQGFSTANRQNIINDPRNKLYKYFIKFINITKPRYVLIENVLGITKKAQDIVEAFNKINYFLKFDILQASDFEIPQNRKRVFFFGVNKEDLFFKNKVESFFDLLKVKKKKTYVTKDALYGLPELHAKQKKNDRFYEDIYSGFNILKIKNFKENNYIKLINGNKKVNFIYNHKARYNNKRDIEIFKKLPQGANSTHESIRDIMPYKKRSHIFKDKYFKLDEEKPCKTITAHMKFDCNMYIHPNQARGLTPREAARIQSFPDDYFFSGPLSKCFMQIGNAVPPLLSLQICRSIEIIDRI